MKIEVEREVDGRWIAETVELAGVMAYGRTREEAIRNVEVIGLKRIADLVEFENAQIPELDSLFAVSS